MREWMFKPGPALLLLVLVAPAPGAVAETATTMREVYDAIAYLLPLSVRDSDDGSEWDDELINSKFAALRSASKRLPGHARADDHEFLLIARSFDQSVARAEIAFRERWRRYGLFAMQEMTAHCVSCHTRIPASGQQWFGEKLRARMRFSELPVHEQVSLLVATRSFEAALDVIERKLSDPEMRPTEADFSGLPIIYLRVGLAADGSLARMIRFFDEYVLRDDMPLYLEARYKDWKAALDEHRDALESEPDLMYARATYAQATGRSPVPGNRARAVDDLVAARLMRDWLDENPDADPRARADIYYHLGTIALRTTESDPSVPDMEMLFVASIEADPGGDYARAAYLLLEEYGFVHDEHLAEQLQSQLVLDMAQLRKAAGLARP